MTEELHAEVEGRTLILRLNRPDCRNALSFSLINKLSDALSAIPNDDSVRSVILTGEGTCFCSGMDLREAVGEGTKRLSAVTLLTAFGDLIGQIRRCPRPTIAALNGDALAGGAGLALACDFTIASETACLGYPEVRSGMVAAIVLADLVQAVGSRYARELLLTGKRITAPEAERKGLVSRVVTHEPVLTHAKAFAHSLIHNAPKALALTKELLDEASGRLDDLRGAAAVSAIVRDSEEAQEGIHAFLEKRTPKWANEMP
jgi:methylglutaconyl-CoA hydratase